jgi:AcrR family transcriptional regulator
MKDEIIKTANLMIAENGLINLSRNSLCERVGIPPGSFTHVMGYTFSFFVETLKKREPDKRLHVVNRTRVEPSLRRDQLLNVALTVAVEIGYNNLTREAIAERAKPPVSPSLISAYFGTIKQLKRVIMRAAVRQKIPEIVAQGLVLKDAHAMKAPQELKTRAATLIASY